MKRTIAIFLLLAIGGCAHNEAFDEANRVDDIDVSGRDSSCVHSCLATHRSCSTEADQRFGYGVNPAARLGALTRCKSNYRDCVNVCPKSNQPTASEQQLRIDIAKLIFLSEKAAGAVSSPKFVSMRQLPRSGVPVSVRLFAAQYGQMPTNWFREEWVIDRDGKNIYYEVILVENPRGGADISIGKVQDTPFSN